jgi:hypothetical protein
VGNRNFAQKFAIFELFLYMVNREGTTKMYHSALHQWACEGDKRIPVPYKEGLAGYFLFN